MCLYSEAIEYLYTANSFSLSTEADEQPTIDYLSYYLLPQRLTQIRDLYFYWELDNYLYGSLASVLEGGFNQWFQSWDVLSKMAGLRHLNIRLSFRLSRHIDFYDALWKGKGQEILEPVKRVTAPREFVITLPDIRCSTDIDVGESKCIFRLPKDDATDDDDTL
ncbi:hypothetical protein N0V83_001442 [Neocucurbitaria cava]|uniref:DUF7730 domain-containing protein n=1 Tax=Neocucurbitaria cava TaxID=798079 RepID=A0A9W9CQE9_9PLEO|nr:hypothetical protein N0V83_001442 [Neocucurbitaria cava]